MSGEDNTADTISLTAVVLTFNRAERCRESLLHNSAALKGAGAEILLVNNGPQKVDISPNVNGVDVRIISPGANRGAESRNLALEHARGDILFFLDDDVYIQSHHVRRMMQVFADDAQAGAVAFRIFNRDHEEASLLPTVFHGCAVGIRKDALKKAGGYPRGYMYYAEEYHVSFRLWADGCAIRFIDEAPHIQHVRDAGGRSKAHIMYRLIRNNARFMTAFIPGEYRVDAFRDMLQRYRLVSIKEQALSGYRKGLLSMPLAVLTGYRERSLLSRERFQELALFPQLDKALLRLDKPADIVLCGTGRFPLLWKKRIHGKGHRVAAFLDKNPCWKGQNIDETPVFNALEDLNAPVILLNGLSSFAETNRWNMQCPGCSSCREITENSAPVPEKHTSFSAPDLKQKAKITLFRFTP